LIFGTDLLPVETIESLIEVVLVQRIPNLVERILPSLLLGSALFDIRRLNGLDDLLPVSDPVFCTLPYSFGGKAGRGNEQTRNAKNGMAFHIPRSADAIDIRAGRQNLNRSNLILLIKTP
jgi:hypothetical protein